MRNLTTYCENISAKDDKELMPPPSAPVRSGTGTGTEEATKTTETSTTTSESKAIDPKGNIFCHDNVLFVFKYELFYL